LKRARDQSLTPALQRVFGVGGLSYKFLAKRSNGFDPMCGGILSSPIFVFRDVLNSFPDPLPPPTRRRICFSYIVPLVCLPEVFPPCAATLRLVRPRLLAAAYPYEIANPHAPRLPAGILFLGSPGLTHWRLRAKQGLFFPPSSCSSSFRLPLLTFPFLLCPLRNRS